MSAPPFKITPRVLLPGILIAATGVGAGDLATAAFTGSHLGTAVLWAVVAGAFMKLVLNEGLARYQLVTGETLLEGAIRKLGWPAIVLFAPYLVVWSFFVAAALMSACGVTMSAMLPVFDAPATGKVVFGIAHSLLGLALVWRGGFRVFEKVMAACAGLMFVSTVASAALMRPDLGGIVRGLLIPTIPDLHGTGLGWTIALIGGIGGTVTVLSYGYWIREEGRTGVEHLKACRVDLACGYLMTAIFGGAMVVIGSTIKVDGSGAALVVQIGERLGEALGPWGRWAFLVGAWGAVFSSLLGVWQAVPLLFADFLRVLTRSSARTVDERGRTYRGYLLAIAIVPMLGLSYGFKDVQKIYAILGATFMPMLALTLLILNGQARWVGEHRNGWLTNALLVLVLAFFVYAGTQGAVN